MWKENILAFLSVCCIMISGAQNLPQLNMPAVAARNSSIKISCTADVSSTPIHINRPGNINALVCDHTMDCAGAQFPEIIYDKSRSSNDTISLVVTDAGVMDNGQWSCQAGSKMSVTTLTVVEPDSFQSQTTEHGGSAETMQASCVLMFSITLGTTLTN